MSSPSGVVYAIDSDSLSKLHKRADGTRICQRLIELIESGTLITHQLVLDEIKKYDKEMYNDLTLVRGQMLKDQTREELWAEVGRISFFYQQMSKPRGRTRGTRNKADPWLIAMGKIYGVTIVTEESPIKPGRIPTTCRREGINCIDLEEFIEIEGLDEG